MGTCFGVITRRVAALLGIGYPLDSTGKRGGATLQQTFGRPMGGDLFAVPQGAGRVLSSPKKCRKDACKSSSQGEGGRRCRSHGSPSTKASQSQGEGEAGSISAGVVSQAKVPDVSNGFVSETVKDGLKLPGSAASAIKVPAFLNSLPRWLLSIHCGFQGFLRSILMNLECNGRSTCTTNSVWPMPLPFPEVFRSGAGSSVAMAHVKRLVSLQIAVLDWFVLGRPGGAPASIRLGSRLSSRQWSVVKKFQEIVVDGNTPEFIDAGDMGRSAAKNEDQEAALAALCRAVSVGHVFDGYGSVNSSRPDSFDDDWLRCGRVIGKLDRGNPCNAKPIVASRITVPDEPKFDPLPHFDRRTAHRYLHPISGGRHPDDVEAPPIVQLRASLAEKGLLLRKLAGAGMLKEVQEGSYYKGFENGMFAVNKDANRDRLVMDSRASNILDRGQSLWSGAMASAASLSAIYLEDDRVILSSGEDLKDYFYQFVVNRERTSRNVLKVAISRAEFAEIFGHPPEGEQDIVRVGLSTLAMGDVCAVEYAQCSHTSLCIKNHVFASEEMISLKGSVPRGLLQAGIIVDDLVILEHVTRSAYESGCLGETEGQTRTARARKAYDQCGLPHNPKKGFVDSGCCRYWGIEIDGIKGLIRSSSLRLWPISIITLRVCSLGVSTVGLLEALAGSWVSLLGTRRRLYSAMELIFEPLGIPDQKAIIRLSPELKSELLSLVVLGSLAVVNIRAPASDFVLATDASLDAMAGVMAPIPRRVSQEITRHCLKKGNWSKLLPSNAAWRHSHGLLDAEDEVPGESFKCNPLWDTVASCFKYKTMWRKYVTQPKHINILELKAFVAEEKRICQRYSTLRIPFGLDSQVVLGAVVKGRASSSAINSILRQSMAYSLGADVYMHFMYFPSALNRADGPTRDREPDPPSMELPMWVDDINQGSYESFDCWMRMHCKEMIDVKLPFDEIGACDELDLRSGRKLKCRDFFSTSRSTASSSELPVDPCSQHVHYQKDEVGSAADSCSFPGGCGWAAPDRAGAAFGAAPASSSFSAVSGQEQNQLDFDEVPRCSQLPLLPDEVSACGPNLSPLLSAGCAPDRTRAAVSAVPVSSSFPVDAQYAEAPSANAKFRSLLSEEAISILRSFSPSQFFTKGPLCFDVPGALDLFSGRCGVAKAMIRLGAPWVLTFDYERGPGQDLLCEDTRKKLVRLFELKAFSSMGAAPICSSFSIAVTPPVRTTRCPRGIRGLKPSMRKKVSEGNSHNDYMMDLLMLCELLAIPYWIENPDSSWWWRQRRWRRFRDSRSPHVFRCCFCRFGTKWRKATRIATNTSLAGLRLWCQCAGNHIPLRGMHPTKKIPWTLVAQPYPRGLCQLLAASLCTKAGWCSPDRLNVVGCARLLAARGGEASNPGPRRVPRVGTLENMPTQRPETLAREARLLSEFLDWCRRFLTAEPVEQIFEASPQLLAVALRRYADHLFQTGGALSNLRHLLLGAQRWRPLVRPHGPSLGNG